MSPDQLLRQGYQFFQQNRLAEAEDVFVRVLAAAPGHPGASRLLGYIRAQQGRHEDALPLMATALAHDPDPAPALVNYGVVQQACGRLDAALASFDRALALKPDLPEALNNRAALLLRLGRAQEALAGFDRALALQPDDPNAHANRGGALEKLGRSSEALASLDRAIALQGNFPLAWNSRGNVLQALGRGEDALASYAQALSLAPRYVEAHYNQGIALAGLHRFAEAAAAYGQALAIDPHYSAARYNRGCVLRDLKRPGEALLDFEQVLTEQPDHADAWQGRGLTLIQMERLAEALESLDRALAIDPRHVNALNDRGFVLRDFQRMEDALEGFEKAVALRPDHPNAFGGLAMTALYLGDWRRTAAIGAQLPARLAQGCVVQSLIAMGYTDDPALLLQASRNYLAARMPSLPPPLAPARPYGHDRIRIAYIASDFGQHVVASVLVELIERHDRARFDCIGISFRPSDGSELRARFEKAFDRLYDVESRSPEEIARLLRDLEVDIAIDLNGHTRDAQPEIFSHRPAPVQVNFLGFPGTLGSGFMDYILADAVIAPFAQQAFFAEKIVHLPGCYLPSDTTRRLAATPSRAQAGLPEQGFVFAAFNAKWKIRPELFDVWMRLLQAVPGSALWLPEHGAVTPEVLRAQATARGVDPGRLVFAPPLDMPEHLARQQLADLFLDANPYNAHSTGADALWAGLPMLTLQGKSFAARVGASLLLAAGLPELVTQSLEEYEAMACRLAGDPALLAGLLQRLAAERETCTLFDMARYCRGLEAAFVTMWERAEKSAAAESFAVTLPD